MDRGTIVAGRFRVDSRHAAGGMGEIHLAMDLQTSSKVALKVLRWHGDAVEARFAREATVLSELSHPAIVRYVSHGRTTDGDAYLAMEWLDGELLSDRLKRGPLSVHESVTLVRRVAEALAVAHARRIVHRDLKPGNLLCEGGEVDKVKVLDFGLARNDAASVLVLTRTGELAGTPGYMAPEQARGLHDVDARADVYSLGCVLYECLTGRPAFSGEHVYAVLAKILVEEAPRVSEVRPDVPRALDDLVARMLAKEVHDRPADAADVLAELARAAASTAPVAAHEPPPRALGRAEQRIICVILAAGESADVDAETAQTVSERESLVANQALQAAVKAFGGTMDRLAGGHVVVTLGGAGSATDLAARAARCALSVAAFLPDKQVAVATGRGVAHERIPVGAAIDQAASLIARAGSEPLGISSVPPELPPRPETEPGIQDAPPSPWKPVRLDEVTAGLLDPRFELGVADGGILLLGFAEYREADRTLLGKPTPFVGRERELANLLGILDECHNEPLAQVVLITGPAGAGKSRLRAEFLRRSREDGAAGQVWVGRGDPMSAGAPLSLLAQMIRREAGILHGEPVRRGRRKLRARVGRHVPAGEVDRVAEFLGEMCGVPFHDERRPELKSARDDAAMMGDQMRRAWEDLLAAECGAAPLTLILEDLQFGDVPTVKFIDSALRALSRRPLMVLALARPEVHELFPDLWASRGLQVVTLRPLTERAARKLIEQTLGSQATAEVVQRIVDQAGGNPFYLEELIRAASLGQDHPGTVVAMIGARLEALPGERRRLLRAASVMGNSFWAGALRSLVGRDDGWIHKELGELVEQEWLVRRAESVRAEDTEYSFRHALVREAAYAMLTDDDRRLGHRLAGEWLELSGGTDAMTIGDHFERGGELARAVRWYARAAKQALDGTDLRAAIDRARRGVDCAAAAAATGAVEDVGLLRAILAEAFNWSGLNAEAEADGVAAMELLPVGSVAWYAVTGQVALAAGRLGHHDRVEQIATALIAAEVDVLHAASWIRATAPTAEMLIYAGARFDLTEAMLARMEALVPAALGLDPAAPARIEVVRALCEGHRGDVGGRLGHFRRAAEIFDKLGHRRRACVQHHDIGFTCLELGAWELGERELRGALAEAERLGMARLATTARQNLGLALAHRGLFDEAERLERQSIEEFAASAERRMQAGSHQYLAIILELRGDLAGAAAEIGRALALEPRTSPSATMSLGVLAGILLKQQRIAEAVAAAREAMANLADLGGGLTEGEGRVRLAWAEALRASGHVVKARAAIATARDRLLALAERISDPTLRECFLNHVPVNARTLVLAMDGLEDPTLPD